MTPADHNAAHRTVIKQIAEADRYHLRAQADRDVDELLETKGVAAVVERLGMQNDTVSFKWFAPFIDAVNALTKRVAELEARPAGVQYRGVWDATRLYAKDEAVTFTGAVWIALSANVSRRPPAAGIWQLAVRKGADGRDCPNCTTTRTGECA